MPRPWATESVSELRWLCSGVGPSQPEVLETIPCLRARPPSALSVEASFQGQEGDGARPLVAGEKVSQRAHAVRQGRGGSLFLLLCSVPSSLTSASSCST